MDYRFSPKADNQMDSISNPIVIMTFQSYPEVIRRKLMFLRKIILEVASNSSEIDDIEETVKWGEPSYLVKGGSTVRIGWKESRPKQYAIYFNCNTKLVDTFKEVYNDQFRFDSNRAIVFHRDDTVPSNALAHCIFLAFQYHKIKHLPLLGV